MTILIASAGLIAAGPEQQTARDAPRRISGTAVVSGVVTTDQADSRPVRRVQVMLYNADRTFGDTSVTDDAGRFEFQEVPAGRYLLRAYKPGMVTARYGASQPGRAGTPLPVSEGQRLSGIELRMAPGAVLTGTIRLANGQPAPDLSVTAKRWVVIDGQRQLRDADNAPSGTSDDRGVYRIFDLPAGEYAIYVTPRRFFMDGPMTARPMTPADIRWAESMLRSGSAAGAGPESETQPRGVHLSYVPVYYPGATRMADAGSVTVAAGQERGGLDVTVQFVPTSSVSGTVARMPPGGDTPRVHLVRADGENEAGSAGIQSVTGERFTFTGLAPGTYALAANTPGGLWAADRVTVSGADVTGIELRLQQGMTVSGRVSIDESATTPTATLPQLTFSLTPVPSGGGLTLGRPRVSTGGDGSFVVDGLMPGMYRLSGGTPAAGSGLFLLAATMDGRDVIDRAFAVEAGRNIGNITVTLTDRPTELGGRLQDRSGRPASDYFIVVFSSDKSYWVPRSRHIQSVRPGSDGRFLVRNLPPGEYRVAALTDVEPDEWFDPAFLEKLLPAASALTLAPGEKKTQDFQIGG